MLKKVMEMLASKYLAIKARIRAIETHLMIQSLLLRDKRMIRHVFRQRKCLKPSNKVKVDVEDEDDEDYQSESMGALVHDSVASTPLINSSIAATPVSMVEVVEDDDDLRHCLYEDEGKKDQSVSVIEMVKNAKEERGKKFVLEEDIDKVADLFIQRFHHQIRLQKRLSDEGI